MANSILRRNFIFSMGFGLAMGLVFPLFARIFATFENPTRYILFSLGCVAAGLFVGYAAYWINSRSFIQTIRFVTGVLEEREGQSSEALRRVIIDSDDEIGTMTRAFWETLHYFETLEKASKATLDTMKGLSGQLEDNMRQSTGAKELFGKTIDLMENAAQEQEHSAQRIKIDYDKLNKTILLNVSTVLELYSNVKEFGDILETQGQILSVVLEGLNQVGEKVGNSANQNGDNLQNLSQSFTSNAVKSMSTSLDIFSKVEESLKEIDNIADRTHVLSINASIEAARLGNEGQGFRVIAGNIKKLSQEVQSLTASLSLILKENNQRLLTISDNMRNDMEYYQQRINDLGRHVGGLMEQNRNVQNSSSKLFDSRKYMEGLLKDVKQNMVDLKEIIQDSLQLVEIGVNSSMVLKRGTQTLMEKSKDMGEAEQLAHALLDQLLQKMRFMKDDMKEENPLEELEEL